MHLCSSKSAGMLQFCSRAKQRLADVCVWAVARVVGHNCVGVQRCVCVHVRTCIMHMHKSCLCIRMHTNLHVWIFCWRVFVYLFARGWSCTHDAIIWRWSITRQDHGRELAGPWELVDRFGGGWLMTEEGGGAGRWGRKLHTSSTGVGLICRLPRCRQASGRPSRWRSV